MSMFTVDVRPDNDEPWRVTVESRDAAQWERRYKPANWSEYERSPNILDSYRMIHIAAMRHGLTCETIDEFMANHDFDFVTEEQQETADPSLSAV